MVRRDQLVHGWREPVATRPAATLILLRDTSAGIAVLMTRRSAQASFAPGVYVFPGGTLDAADSSEAARHLLQTRPDQDAAEQHHAAAALRETFEELGILLAHEQASGRAVDPARVSTLQRDPDTAFYAQLEAAGLRLAVDQTAWFSHWITDRDLPRRFDVRFLVAPMPAGQIACADEQEQFEPTWIAPAEALARHEAGRFDLIFPTLRTLRQLARFASTAEVLAFCRAQSSVYTSCPRGGFLAGREVRYTEDEAPFGELEFVAPDGQVVHALDWQSDRIVSLRHNIRRLTAPNPGRMTGPGTNTYLVGNALHCVVIDPGPAIDAHIDRLAEAVHESLSAIICTHSHADHSPGAALLQARVGRDVPILGRPSGPHARPTAWFRPDRTLEDGECIEAGDALLRVVCTPGHAANHLCLVLEADRVLFSGDHVLNGSTTVVDPPDGDMLAYLASLDRLTREPVDFILPAHGYVLAPAVPAMQALARHRLAREEKVLTALRAAGPSALESLVPHAYADVPVTLHGVAARSLLAHLLKLQAEGRAKQTGESWHLA